MKRLTTAERVLKSLGISEPREIDLEAIAWHLGVRVKFRPLDGCEARIMGKGDQAIITVDSKSHPRRQRFSIGHELGHWEFHRGKIMVCRSDDIGRFVQGVSSSEAMADRYAADMILPNYLFCPMLRDFSKLNFDVIRKIADTFEASITATAIRFIQSNEYPAILVSHGKNGRNWFSRSKLVPDRWFPRDELQPVSSAFDVLFGKKSNDVRPYRVNADAWFDRYNAHYYEIHEQAFKISDDEVLCLLIIEHEDMLEEL